MKTLLLRFALRIYKRELERLIRLDRFDKDLSARIDAVTFLLEGLGT
jgi:hypothetical protein